MSKKQITSNGSVEPRTTSYEFLGPPGAFLITILTFIFPYTFAFACSEKAGGCPRSFSELPAQFMDVLSDVDWWKAQWDPQGFAAYFAWYAFTIVAWAVIPGDWVDGLPLRTGDRLQYKINAFSTMLLALGIVGGLIFTRGPSSFTYIYEHWVGILTGATANAIVQAMWCYLSSFREGRLLALGGNSGNHLYDWFMGRELNPRIGIFDIKTFNELRPGMILWTLINISMACEQASRRGGTITDSMWLVLVFQGWYVADALYNEPALFSTMDVASDGFGFMLSIGDLVWLPFTYSLQARYLAWNPVELGPVWTAAIFTLHGLGYYIFRSANGEKNDFRNGKNPKGLSYMDTKRGTKLITSGWWGASRHPNYFGDLIMGLSWCLPTAFGTPVTYYYIVFFTILLVHRQRRDDEACQHKYGDDWNEYKRRVPWRIVPGVY
ncbi:erg24, C-14 sterol reductase [Serendipita sp. 399]|nr:erg24, C-14 sterol reductase [Serendipita sp. 399]